MDSRFVGLEFSSVDSLSKTLPRKASVSDPARVEALSAYVTLDADGNLADDLAAVAETFRGLAEVAARIAGAQGAVINLVGARQQTRVAAYGVSPGVCSVNDSMCAVLLHEQSAVVLPDARLDERYSDNPFVNGTFGQIRGYASVPLNGDTGYSLGTLCVFDSNVNHFDPHAIDGLQRLADQVVGMLELRRRSAQIAHAHAELERSHTLLKEFAGRVSHDVKSPLSSVIGFAELLAGSDSVAQDKDAASYLDRIRGAARRMDALVDDMLAFAAVGSSSRWELVDLADLVAEVTDDLFVRVESTHAAIHCEKAEFLADAGQVRVVLLNLIGNALKYCHPDRPPMVDISVSRTAEGWTLHVADNGLGVPADKREDILVPLRRLDRDHHVQGTGLGLATCVRLAEAWGGSVTVGESDNHGTVISVSASPPAQQLAHVS